MYIKEEGKEDKSHNHPIVKLYQFSPIAKWHQSSFCLDKTIHRTKDVTIAEFVLMDEHGRICKRCKGPVRAA